MINYLILKNFILSLKTYNLYLTSYILLLTTYNFKLSTAVAAIWSGVRPQARCRSE